MTIRELTSKDYFNLLGRRHTLMMGAMISLTMLGIFLARLYATPVENEWIRRTLLIIIPLAALFGLYQSALRYSNAIRRIREEQELHEKLYGYRRVLLLFYSYLEIPALLAILGYMFTGNFLFLAITVFLFFIYTLHKPSRIKLTEDLSLSQSDRELLEDPYAVVLTEG